MYFLQETDRSGNNDDLLHVQLFTIENKNKEKYYL